MSISVLQPGAMTTVQDLGRKGYQRFGVPVSGCVDARSAIIANILVGNPDGAAVLECTLIGPRLLLEQDAVFAVTGADLSPTLDGQSIPTYRAVCAKAGQVIGFGAVKCGCRAYIAFSGGINIPEVMHSRSTFIRAAIGGIQGRKLAAEDKIEINLPSILPANLLDRGISPEYCPREVCTLRVLLGPQEDAFTEQGIATFLGGTFRVTNQSDRMGCRLSGPEIGHRGSCDIISDGIVFGSVQVPASGQPIIMLADRQTTGGYTKIATVISADFRLLGQLKGQDAVRFEHTTIQEAQEALICERKALRCLRRSMEYRT